MAGVERFASECVFVLIGFVLARADIDLWERLKTRVVCSPCLFWSVEVLRVGRAALRLECDKRLGKQVCGLFFFRFFQRARLSETMLNMALGCRLTKIDPTLNKHLLVLRNISRAGLTPP